MYASLTGPRRCLLPVEEELESVKTMAAISCDTTYNLAYKKIVFACETQMRLGVLLLGR